MKKKMQTKSKMPSLLVMAGLALVSLGGMGFAINLSIQGTQTVVSSTASTSGSSTSVSVGDVVRQSIEFANMDTNGFSGTYIVGNIATGMCYKLGSLEASMTNRVKSVVLYTGDVTGSAYVPTGTTGTFDCAVKNFKINLQGSGNLFNIEENQSFAGELLGLAEGVNSSGTWLGASFPTFTHMNYAVPSSGHENALYAPTFGKIDSDSYTDMIVFGLRDGACSGSACINSTGDSNIYIGYGKADGSFEYNALTGVSSYLPGVGRSDINIRTIIDMNADGLKDIVLVFKQKEHQTVVAINNGDKTFTIYKLSTAGINIPGDMRVYGGLVKDLNGDGAVDIATARVGTTLKIMRGTPASAGTFDSTFTVQSLAGPSTAYLDVIAVDIDNDGHEDLLTPQEDNGYEAFWYKGTGGTGFTRMIITGSSTNCSQMNYADMNNDTKLDIVCSIDYTPNVEIWYQTTGSLFTGKQTVMVDYAVGNMYSNVYIQDINHDTTPDILVMDPAPAYDGYLRASTRGIAVSSGSTWAFNTGTFPLGFYQDLNNDNIVDYVTHAGLIGFLADNQALNKTDQMELGSTAYSFSDVNADGNSDILSKNGIFLNNGYATGTYMYKITFDEHPVSLRNFNYSTRQYTGSDVTYSFVGVDGNGDCNLGDMLGGGAAVLGLGVQNVDVGNRAAICLKIDFVGNISSALLYDWSLDYSFNANYMLSFESMFNTSEYSTLSLFGIYDAQGNKVDEQSTNVLVKATVSPAGGGSSSIAKDSCSNGDKSPSFYDGVCTASVATPDTVTQHAAATTTVVSPFLPEINEAYTYAYKLGLTNAKNVNRANIEGTINRAQFAKIMSIYATKVLKKTPNTDLKCEFKDIANESNGARAYIKQACQLGLMGVDQTKFLPKKIIDRAQFGSILSRALYGDVPEDGKLYYTKHLQALKSAGILNKIARDPEQTKERLGYIFLMLERADKGSE